MNISLLKSLVCCTILIACNNQTNQNIEPSASAPPILEAHEVDDRYSVLELIVIHASLPVKIKETSGLLNISNTFWTNNDSGGEPHVYEMNVTSGEVARTVKVNEAENIDWEELTRDESHVYIGNFGNNLGKRDNLMIYKVSIEEMLVNDNVDAEEIHFSYPDQTKFYNGYNHNHDAEAMIAYGDSIYIFSKNWDDRRCKLYRLPKTPGTYDAELISEFNAEGTITGAALSEDLDRLLLLGYVPGKGFDPFVWDLTDWTGSDFFSGSKVRYNFDRRRQTEGIVFNSDTTALVSAEDEEGSDPSLFQIDLPE